MYHKKEEEMDKWEVKCLGYDRVLDAAIAIEEGWEPFAATCLGNPSHVLIWLRRKTEEAYKTAA